MMYILPCMLGFMGLWGHNVEGRFAIAFGQYLFLASVVWHDFGSLCLNHLEMFMQIKLFKLHVY